CMQFLEFPPFTF
nr:immunoglobulin light chain junction region [Macaca mulatta]MOW51795.1 immunoglobulin light chain junction region [Macaca mulatta]MOW55308.1 immunoglobulin light chain junction region [Macaca mulatta]